MQPPAKHPTEHERLLELESLQILDTPPEERYDRITRIAQVALDAPIALVSLIDEQRQWFKSRQGLDVPETPRDISFCGHAVAEDRMLIVQDAAEDRRFSDNPLVAGEPRIRFYAGQVLHGPRGFPIGTLCVIDRRPRVVSGAQIQVLRDLAALVEQELSAAHLAEDWKRNRERSRFFEELVDTARDLVEAVDATGRIVYVNNGWRVALGYEDAPVPERIFDVIAPEEHAHCRELFAEAQAGKDVSAIETVFLTRTGERVAVAGNVRLYARGGQTYTQAVFHDIRSAVKARESLRELAMADALTGLLNRRGLAERSSAMFALSIRNERALSVAMLDLDHFKRINNSFGHGAGDRVLQRLGRLLASRARASDLVARLGGEEFCLVLPETNVADARAFVDSLRIAFSESGRSDPPAATFSAGIAAQTKGAATLESLLVAADVALYQAKREGRDRVVVGST